MQDYRTFYLGDRRCGLCRYRWHKPRISFMLQDMDSPTTAHARSLTWSAHLPSWALARGRDIDESDAAFAAGIALKSLDDLICADPQWIGCWRDRLALKSAVVVAKMLGRNEEEDALRDAVLLTPADGDPGPAGKLFLATRMLARRAAMPGTGRCHVVRLRPDEALSVKLRELRRSRPSSAPWRGSDECGWRGRSVFDATGRNDF